MTEELSRKIRNLAFVATIMVAMLHSYNLTTRFASGTQDIANKSVTSFVENFISHGIARIAVPFFSIISGYLFFQNLRLSVASFRDKLISRTKSLAVPYLLWSCFGFMFFYVMQTIPFSSAYFTHARVTGYTAGQIIESIIFDPIPSPIWFIRDLFLLTLLCPIVYFVLSKAGIGVVILAGIMWFTDTGLPFIRDGQLCFYAPKEGQLFFYMIKDGGLFFYLIGSLIAVKNLVSQPLIKRPRWLLVLWILMVSVDIYHFTIRGDHLWYLYKAAIFIGVTAFWYNYSIISPIFKKEKIYQLTFCRFFIYVSHEPFLTILKKLWIKTIGASEVSNLLAYFLCPVVIVSISIVMSLILRKKTSKFYAILTGGR